MKNKTLVQYELFNFNYLNKYVFIPYQMYPKIPLINLRKTE